MSHASTRIAARVRRLHVGPGPGHAVASRPERPAGRPAGAQLRPGGAVDRAEVSTLVFDTSVTPRWLETSDRFWYAYQTREGRRFYIVDPLKKAKTPLFDHAKMAAALTSITRIPYDAQHLPFSTVRFVKKDTAFEFDFQVPATPSSTRPSRARRRPPSSSRRPRRRRRRRRQSRDEPAGRSRSRPGRRARQRRPRAPRRRATRRCTSSTTWRPRGSRCSRTTSAEPRPPRWASLSPDEQDHPLRAQSQPLHDGRRELRQGAQERRTTRRSSKSQLTTDGEDYYGYGRAAAAAAATRTSSSSNSNSSRSRTRTSSSRKQREDGDAKNARVRAVQRRRGRATRASSRSSAATSRKVKDLWVINPLANPRPTLETYRYAMPGEENIAAVGDLRLRREVEEPRQDQGGSLPGSDRQHRRPSRSASRRRRRRRTRQRGGPQPPPRPQEWLQRRAGQAVLHAPQPRHASPRRLRRRHGDRRGQAAHRRAAEHLHRVEAAAPRRTTARS